jgi:hypothetical protein
LTAGGALVGEPDWNGGCGSYSRPSWTVWACCGPDLVHEREGEVDPGRDAAAGEHVAVAHDTRLLRDGPDPRQEMVVGPVRRRPLAA